MLFKKKIQIFSTILITSAVIILIHNKRHENNYYKTEVSYFFTPSKVIATYSSTCECNKDKTITLEDYNDKEFAVFLAKNQVKTHLYNFPKDEFNLTNIKCNPYASLRRGPNQKVISYTLYGKNRFFYDKLLKVSEQIKELYPGWLMRVYHNSSIDTSIICQLECQTDEDSTLIDNSDFCDVTEIKINMNDRILDPNKYILPMVWRWFPIGDRFVDVFSSRDTDSFIFQREVDSARVWLESNKIGHIMRDHPWHATQILGGMWGLKLSINRKLANQIYKILIDPKIMNKLNPANKGPKGADQLLLRNYVYKLIKDSSIIHDSFLCSSYGGSPWPTKRVGDCYVGSVVDCTNTSAKFFQECPKKCRPKEHQDWNYC